ncbi:unnamed protein product [Vitrella brassicaformis CCMP3155]|uniref:EGF-like domain-containing protein n=1 Tax=Vitrella brassicaformis (strain CCMP3155) TaxID=1169540 RepID=A0A0G4ENP7_VITBC|nr:unnamed protein product [Vitrella brassicaformis CCMP3155]|eukprot:CEL98614.1 unnamed protein product [Vitrella brassicaformis CCMP3155]
MEELVRCDSCQEDAAALFEWSHGAGLADNDTKSAFEYNLCVVSFITCVRLSEALADGGPREGYIIFLTGSPEEMEVSDVPGILVQRGGAPFVFSEAFYRLRHVVCFYAYHLPMQGSLADDIARVTSLRAIVLFEVHGMNGPLPATIGELPYLKSLYLWSMNSKTTGPIPPSITNLSRLEALELTRTDLSGPIPEDIGRLRRLRVLNIWGNKRMEGPFPAGVTSCRNLTRLDLHSIGLLGSLPDDLGDLSRLQVLNLRGNSLSGELPQSLVQLSQLRRLDLYENNFIGSLPDGLGTKMDSLQKLGVSRNNFSGPLPSSLGDARSLTRLAMREAGLSGSISSELGQLVRLRQLHLGVNQLSGPIPSELGLLVNLRELSLKGNQLSGALPDTLSGWKSIEYLNLRNNKFIGTLDPLSNLTSLRQLWIGENSVSPDGKDVCNKFAGTLEPLSDLTSLRRLWVGNNSFEGHLPVGFSAFKNLSRITADNNRLVGFVEHSLRGRGYESLHWLQVDHNRLNGSVDLSVFPKLENARLDHNLITRVTGSIPQSLRSLDLSDNLLTTLPEGFHSMPNLEKLYLANNHISQWPNLYELDVSNNPINVDVTEFFMPLKWQNNLVVLDASNCDLYGAMRCEAFLTFPRRLLGHAAEVGDSLDERESVTAFRHLGSISLSNNNITAIATFQAFESPLYHVDIRNNSLRRVGRPDSRLPSSDYARFTQNPDLRSEQTDVCISLTPIEKCNDLRRSSGAHQSFIRCPSLTAYDDPRVTPLVPDPQGYVVRTLENGEERFECTEFCSVHNRLEVDYTFASDALCRCLPGYEGTGINCTKCPPDTYSNREIGTQTCKQCPDDAGSEEGSPACYCRLGHQRGEEPCEPCTAGSIGVRKGGADGSRIAWICQDCLPGLDCSVPVNYNASVLPGFFQLTVQLQSAGSSHNATREVTTYGARLTSLPIVTPCPLPSACIGTNKTNGLNICSEGHEGFVCSRCKAGFSRQTPQQPCTECAPLWQIAVVNVLLLVATLMAIFILTALAERAASSLGAEVPSQLTKIGLSHITAVCGLAFLAFDKSSIWGDQISSLLGRFFAWDGGIAQSYQVCECVLRPYVGDECVLYRHAMWLALPLIWLTAVPLIASGFDKARHAFKSRRRIGSDQSTPLATDTHLRALSTPPSVTDGRADNATAAHGPYQRTVTFQNDSRTEPVTRPSCQHSSAEPPKSGRWRQWLDNRGTMMVVILTFLHPTVTKNMLALLRCRWYPYVDGVIFIAPGESVSLLPIDPMDDMRPRMDLDSHVICRSAEHAPFLWIAVAGLLLWTFAPVIGGVAFLWRHRDGLQDHHTRRRVGFLYAGYRKNFYYWDAIFAMRRVLVLLIAQQATAQPRQ